MVRQFIAGKDNDTTQDWHGADVTVIPEPVYVRTVIENLKETSK